MFPLTGVSGIPRNVPPHWMYMYVHITRYTIHIGTTGSANYHNRFTTSVYSLPQTAAPLTMHGMCNRDQVKRLIPIPSWNGDINFDVYKYILL